MALYDIVWRMLAWSLTVALLWPMMFPWSRLAYKVWHGNTPIDEDVADELWVRSAYASVLTSVVAALFAVLDYATASPDWLGMPPGPVHVVYYLGFLTLAGSIMHYCYGLEDLFQGLSMAVVYLYIPAAILVALSYIVDWNPLLDYVKTWLTQPKDLT